MELLEKLVNIESPSGDEEEIIFFIEDYLSSNGFSPKIEDKNLILKGSSDLWFVTHVDTVKVKRKFEVYRDFAYGTGVCDAKASITAILKAVEILEEPKFNIALFSDEEENGIGSKIFSEKYRGRAIVMEPTSLKIAKTQYGSAEIVVKVRDKSFHGAYYFNKGAIEKAYDLYNILKEKNYAFSIQKIVGGSDEYIIPESCEMRLSFIFDPDINVKDEIEKIGMIISEFGDYHIIEDWQGFYCDYIWEIEKFSNGYTDMISWTDAVNLKLSGWKVTIWGPGELEKCHTYDERIRIDEIEKAVNIIKNVNNLL